MREIIFLNEGDAITNQEKRAQVWSLKADPSKKLVKKSSKANPSYTVQPHKTNPSHTGKQHEIKSHYMGYPHKTNSFDRKAALEKDDWKNRV